MKNKEDQRSFEKSSTVATSSMLFLEITLSLGWRGGGRTTSGLGPAGAAAFCTLQKGCGWFSWSVDIVSALHNLIFIKL